VISQRLKLLGRKGFHEEVTHIERYIHTVTGR
jgi:hypothetical protein